MKHYLVIICCILLTLLNAGLLNAEKMVVRFESPNAETIKEFGMGDYDVATYKPSEFLDIVISQEEMQILKKRNVNFRITQTESQLRQNLNEETDLYGYRDYEETLAELQQIEADYPEICKLYDLGDSRGKIYSENGISTYDNFNHEIWGLKISDNVLETEDEPGVYYFAEHHSREPISLEVCMAVIYHIIENYGTNSEITFDVNNTEIWFIPLVNPNGHKVVTDGTNLWWRKNICDNNGNQVMNVNSNGEDGVDPNRNYGWEWGTVGASNNWTSETYHGTEAWSEPEIQAVRNLMETKDFVAGISYHSYSELVLFPFGYNNNVIAPDHAALQDLAIRMAETIPSANGGHYTPQESWELYPCQGTTDDYSYGEYGTFSFTVELGTEFIPPAGQVNGICDDNIEAAMIMLERVQKSSLTGIITNAVTGEPIIGEIFIDGIDNTGVYKKPYNSNEQFGRYHRLLIPQNYNVTYSAFGYEPITINSIAINSDTQTIQNVELNPVANVSFSGIVTDNETNQPIENAIVTIQNTPIQPLNTNSNGEFQFSSVPLGIYTISIFAENYSTYICEINLNEATNYIFQLQAPTFVDNFENGMNNWNSSGSWNVTNSNSFSGEFSLTDSPAGTYNNNINTSTELNNHFDTSEAEQFRVSFMSEYSIEENYDYCYFQISTNPPNNWITLDTFTGSSNWENHVYELENYIGNDNVAFRFKLTSDGYVVDDGIYIDDFAVEVINPSSNIVYGDVDFNGLIQAFDASMTLQSTVNLISLTPDQIIAADVDGNSLVQAFDASLILQYIVGLITEFPVENQRNTTELRNADVTVTIENDELIFNAKGNLFACEIRGENINFDNAKSEILLAQNSNFVAVASENIIDGEFLRIPFSSLQKSAKLEMIINTKKVEIYLDNAPQISFKGQYPNPFNPICNFGIESNLETNAQINIYNIKGAKVDEISSKVQSGSNVIQWNADQFASGVYFYRIEVSENIISGKMLLLK